MQAQGACSTQTKKAGPEEHCIGRPLRNVCAKYNSANKTGRSGSAGPKNYAVKLEEPGVAKRTTPVPHKLWDVSETHVLCERAVAVAHGFASALVTRQRGRDT